MKKIINTDKAPGAIGPYSQGTALDNMIYTSGQLPIDATTGKMVNGIKEQTKMSLLNVKSILEEAGSCMENVMKTTVYLSDISNFADMNIVYSEFFTENFPSRSAFEVAALPLGALVEIEVIAYKK